MNSYIVYKYTSPSGKSYIGITSKPLIKRANYNGTGYTACPHFCKAIKKYGWENMRSEILYTGLSKEEAEQKEIELIALYDTTNPAKGYNADKGGNCAGTHSPETRAKMSNSLKGKPIGRKVGAETREKHRDYLFQHNPQKGKPLTEAQKQAISESMSGRFTGSKNHKARAVKCITTGETFPTVAEAGRRDGVAYMSIIQSIQHKNGRRYAGSKDGTPLQWEYVTDKGE